MKILNVYITMHYLKLAILLSLFAENLQGQQFPEPMVPFRLVNDFTGMLTPQQQIDLNNKLQTFNNKTSTQIYVVTYDDLQGYPIYDFGARLGEEWGIGQKDKDNGILILISPENHEITIQTGYGLEGAVPDAIAKRLISNVITPSFREEDYYTGLDSVTTVLISLTEGEFTAEEYISSDKSGINPVVAIILIIIFIVLFSRIFRTSRQYYSPTHAIPWWMMGKGSSQSRGWGSFSSGGGSFGGFSGGGGGSFGGGGASGRW